MGNMKLAEPWISQSIQALKLWSVDTNWYKSEYSHRYVYTNSDKDANNNVRCYTVEV